MRFYLQTDHGSILAKLGKYKMKTLNDYLKEDSSEPDFKAKETSFPDGSKEQAKKLADEQKAQDKNNEDYSKGEKKQQLEKQIAEIEKSQLLSDEEKKKKISELKKG